MNEATEALNSIIPPTGYQEWLTLSMAYKAAGGDFSSWLEWCKRGANPISEAEAPAKWETFKPGPITKATLYKAAQENGWRPAESPKNTAPARQTDKETPAENAARITIEQSRRDAGDWERAYSYLESRGISKATAERFKVGYLAGRNEVIFPYLGEQKPYYAARNTATAPNGEGARWRMPGGLQKTPYNLETLDRGPGDVFLVEGQIDVLSIEDAGGRAITAEGCEAILAKAAKETGENIRFLIIPDNDADPAKGEKTAARMLDALTAAGQTAYLARIPANYHDANDYLTQNREGLAEWIQTAGDRAANETREAYSHKSAAANVDGWAADWESGKDSPLSTGLVTLDELLDGGLYPGLYVIGALSSLGKTSLCLQIADFVAKSKDVLYVALEQSAAELTAKTLSRLTADLSQMNGNEYKDALTARSITSRAKRARAGRDQIQTLSEAIRQYKTGIGKNIFFLDAMSETRPIGTADIKKRLEEHKNSRGEYPLVIVDYMQILAPADPRATDKQNADRNIVELKKTARGLNIPIIGISSFNRENYNNRLSLAAYKESGAIEYTADVVAGIQPRGMIEVKGDKDTGNNREIVEACKNSVLRELEIVVLKNRQGRTGAVRIVHNTMYNLIEDEGETGKPDISGIIRRRTI